MRRPARTQRLRPASPAVPGRALPCIPFPWGGVRRGPERKPFPARAAPWCPVGRRSECGPCRVACGAGPARRAAYRRLDGAGSSRRSWRRAQCRDRRGCLGRAAAGAAPDPPACWRGGPGARLTSRPPGPALCDFQARATGAVHEPPARAGLAARARPPPGRAGARARRPGGACPWTARFHPRESGATRGAARVYGGDRRRGAHAGTDAVPDARPHPGGRQPAPRRASSLPGGPCRRGGTPPNPPSPPAHRSRPPPWRGPGRTAASSFEPPRRAVPGEGNAADPARRVAALHAAPECRPHPPPARPWPASHRRSRHVTPGKGSPGEPARRVGPARATCARPPRSDGLTPARSARTRRRVGPARALVAWHRRARLDPAAPWWAGELDSMASGARRAGGPSRGPPATMPPVCVDLAISQTGGSATRGSARVYGGDRRRGTRAGTDAVPDARQPPGGRPPPPRRASSLLRPRRGPGRTARRASGLSPLDGRVRGRRDFTDGSPAQRAAPLGCMGGIGAAGRAPGRAPLRTPGRLRVADRLRRVERRACSALGLGPGRAARRACGRSPLDGRVRGRRDFTDGGPAQRAVALGGMGGIGAAGRAPGRAPLRTPGRLRVAGRLRRVERRACCALGLGPGRAARRASSLPGGPCRRGGNAVDPADPARPPGAGPAGERRSISAIMAHLWE